MGTPAVLFSRMRSHLVSLEACWRTHLVPLSYQACASKFPRYASDSGLIVANGSYAITADHCVQCAVVGQEISNLYCMPASLSTSCSSMQCRSSNLMLGNFTAQSTSAGCNAISCSYGGFVNGTILTTQLLSCVTFGGSPHHFNLDVQRCICYMQSYLLQLSNSRVISCTSADTGTNAGTIRCCCANTGEFSAGKFCTAGCFSCKWPFREYFHGTSIGLLIH